MEQVKLPEHLLGIVGHPLSHSLSPVLHNWGFRQSGFPGVYLRWELPPERLPGFIEAVRTLPIHGVSVTIPHKQKIVSYLDGISPAAAQVGAVNTLYWREGRLLGENTDVDGFNAPLLHAGMRPKTALVLGAGGAARAVVAGLQRLGVKKVWVSSRDPGKSVALAREFEAGMLPWRERGDMPAELVVNATPLGMKGGWEARSPWPTDRFPAGVECVYDLVYNPEETILVQLARRSGIRVLSGLSMFLHQGLAQFLLWTGLCLEEPEVSAVLRQALNERGQSNSSHGHRPSANTP
jgi:shikimate dehydrogenase